MEIINVHDTIEIHSVAICFGSSHILRWADWTIICE